MLAHDVVGILARRTCARQSVMLRGRAAACPRSSPNLSRPTLPALFPLPFCRTLTSSASRRHTSGAETTQPLVSQQSEEAANDPTLLYTGPLANTFRRLKLFSLASLALSFAMTPIILTVSSSLPFSARAALAGTALLTSSVSTGLVAWAGRPYVVRMRRLAPGSLQTADSASGGHAAADHHAPSHNDNTPAGIELETLSMTLAPLRTRVYDPVALADTRRPFARWELAGIVQLPEAEAKEVAPGMEETIAETVDRSGEVVGRWIVKWGEGGEGMCRAQGLVVRHFNVHEDLLKVPIR